MRILQVLNKRYLVFCKYWQLLLRTLSLYCQAYENKVQRTEKRVEIFKLQAVAY